MTISGRILIPLTTLLLSLLVGCSQVTESSTAAADSEKPSTNAPTNESADPEGSEANATTAIQGKVVVLSSRDEQFMDPLWDLVRKRHPNLELIVDYGKDSGSLDRLRAERESPRVDLLISKGSAAVEAAAAEGLLATLPAGSLQRAPEPFRGPNDHWVGLSARARILVARRGIEPPPKNIDVLADPAWAGKVGRTVSTNSSFVGGIAALIASQGEDEARRFLKGLAENTEDGNLVFPKHTPTVASVAEGRAEIALVNHYYYYRNVLGKRFDPSLSPEQALAKIAAAPIEALYVPTAGDGVAWNVSSAGLVLGGPNPAAAQALLDVLLSEEGQRIYAWTNREYPVVEGVPAAAGVRPASDFEWSKTSLPELARMTPVAVRLIQELGLK